MIDINLIKIQRLSSKKNGRDLFEVRVFNSNKDKHLKTLIAFGRRTTFRLLQFPKRVFHRLFRQQTDLRSQMHLFLVKQT